MSQWNTDLAEAPRGFVEEKEVNRAGKTYNVKQVHTETIITASHCGKVIVTHYLPDKERWNLYADKERPIAWQPLPKHPMEETKE